MKSSYCTLDVLASVTEMQRLVGLRVSHISHVNDNTFLVKLRQGVCEAEFIFEAGVRVHITTYDWTIRRGCTEFCGELVKNLKYRVLKGITQLGADCVFDFQFGTEDELSCHLFIEVFSGGNITLTDNRLSLLSSLRPFSASDKFKCDLGERYPVELATQREVLTDEEKYNKIISIIEPGQELRTVMNSMFSYGPSLVEHTLALAGLKPDCKLGDGFDPLKHDKVLTRALWGADLLVKIATLKVCRGVIVRRRILLEAAPDYYAYEEYHPFHFEQHEVLPCIDFNTFHAGVDEYFSSKEVKKMAQAQEAFRRGGSVVCPSWFPQRPFLPVGSFKRFN